MMVSNASSFANQGPDLRPGAAPRPRRRARAGEILLADALDREARAPQGRLAVLVRLSRLPPPGSRPYHRRIARALLEDCAQRHGGQVFQLSGGDLVLLSTPPPGAGPDAGPLALPSLLTRLLQADGAAPVPLAEAIPLAEGQARLRALLAAADAAPDHPEDEADAAAADRPRNIFAGRRAASPLVPPASAADDLLAGGIADLLGLQTAVRLPQRGAAPSTPIRPVHRALRVIPALLAARLTRIGAHLGESPPEAAGRFLPADPWLRQHLAGSLAEAVLTLLGGGWGGGTPLDATPRRGVPPLLLSLPPAVVNGPGFAAFAARFAAADATQAPRVAISMAEASADPAGFAAARTRLRDAGMPLVLDGLSHHTLLLARPEALEPDLVALAWSSALPRLAAARRDEIAAAVGRVGTARVLLTGADSEAALRWGRAAGILLFQGQHADAMLAATRIIACPGAGACQLRACAERATATSTLGRLGCTRPRLLDQGVPDPVHRVA